MGWWTMCSKRRSRTLPKIWSKAEHQETSNNNICEQEDGSQSCSEPSTKSEKMYNVDNCWLLTHYEIITWWHWQYRHCVTRLCTGCTSRYPLIWFRVLIKSKWVDIKLQNCSNNKCDFNSVGNAGVCVAYDEMTTGAGALCNFHNVQTNWFFTAQSF